MRGQHVLNLGWIDVLAAGDVHILFTTDDVVVALFVAAHEVTGMPPAVAIGLGRRVGPSPVAGADMWAGQRQLPYGARCHVAVILIQDTGARVKYRAPHRAGLAQRIL